MPSKKTMELVARLYVSKSASPKKKLAVPLVRDNAQNIATQSDLDAVENLTLDLEELKEGGD
jgi:hypothetical protein